MAKVEAIDPTNRPFFLWHVYFADVFEQGGFDIVIANPPYVSIKDIDKQLLQLYRSIYKTAKGQTDLYAIFIEKAIKLLNKQGTIAFIVPDSINDRSNFELTRAEIFKNLSLSHLLTMNEVFESANVGSTVFVASEWQSDNVAQLMRTQNINTFVENQIEVLHVSQSSMLNNDKYSILFIDEKSNKLLLKLHNNPTVSAFCYLGRGEEIGRKSNAILSKKDINTLSFIAGDDFSRYSTINVRKYIDEKEVKKNINALYVPKIIVRQVGKVITSTYDEYGCVIPQSVYAIIPKEGVAFKFILALLNSKLFDFIYQKSITRKSCSHVSCLKI